MSEPTLLLIFTYAPALNWWLGASHGASGAWLRMYLPFGSVFRSVDVNSDTHFSAFPSPLFIAARSS